MGNNNGNGNGNGKAKSPAAKKLEEYRAFLKDTFQRGVTCWVPLLQICSQYNRQGGPVAAIMASQIIYWFGTEEAERRGGWIWKTQKEMEAETGLSLYNQQTARKVFEQSGIIEFERKGTPPIYRYKPNWEKIVDLINTELGYSRSTVLPYNGTPIEGDSRSMEVPVNVLRDSRGRFSGTPRNSLNKELIKTTSSKLLETTSSSSQEPGGGEEQEELLFSEFLLNRLDEIGIFPEKRGEVLDAINRGWSEEQILDRINKLEKQEEGQPEKQAAPLLLYQLKQKPPKKGREPSYRRYIEDEYADFVEH